MPIRNLNEDEIKKIAAKYISNVKRNADNIPNIQNVIREAIKNASPGREFDSQDVTSVLSKLKRRPIINDKAIHEAAKEVVDHSAMEDLKHMIGHNVKQLKKKATDQDIEAIIKHGKLNPHSALLPQIKKAVSSYYATGRPLEYIPPAELQSLIQGEMGKTGPTDDREVKSVMTQYIEDADQEKPFDLEAVRRLIKSHTEKKKSRIPLPVQNVPTGIGPKPTQVSVPPRPGDKNQKEEQPTKQAAKPGGFVPPRDPKHLTFFEKIRMKLQRYGIKSLTKGARNWLTDEVSSLKRMDRQKFLKEGQTVAEAFIGKMFMYFYDAKTKETLPYWDKFPLIFVIELYNDGWLGLNLHYLDRNLRMKLFDRLLKYANDKSLDKITKLRLSYSLLKNISKFPEVRPCIKRYLSTQVKSQLLPVEAIDWEIALFLPVEQFQKETRETVWGESKKMVSRIKKGGKR